MNWLAWDLETTGLHDPVYVVQIGLVAFVDREIVDSEMRYVKPPISIPEAASNVHGITDDFVDDFHNNALEHADAMDRFVRLIQSWEGALLTYNGTHYDERIVKYHTNPNVFDGLNRIDVFKIIKHRKIGQHWNGKKLMDAVRQLDIDQSGSFHDARDDSLYTGLVFRKLIERFGESTIASVIKATHRSHV